MGAAHSQYAGSSSCGACHSAQFAGQSKSGHARALSRSSGPGEWAFGAGVQAITYVSRLNDEFYLEHGLSYYSSLKGTALTPGHRSPEGERYRTFAADAAILRCFQCHSTGPLKLGADFRIEPFEAGVRCEVCHGAGAEHAAGKAALQKPDRLSAAELNRFCGTCHRMPSPAGESTDWTNAWNVRHQPLYLDRSRCFRESRGKLTCLTCHDPHQPLARDAAVYDAKCASCHAKLVNHAERRSCTACHMPPVEPGQHLRFANHWIGVYAPAKPLQPIARVRSTPRAAAAGKPR